MQTIDRILEDCTSSLESKAGPREDPARLFLSKAERDERKMKMVSDTVEQRMNYLTQLAEPVVKSSSTLAEISHKLKLLITKRNRRFHYR